MQLHLYSKGDLSLLEKNSRSDDPAESLSIIEGIMEEINIQQIQSGDALTRHFITFTLHRIIVGLMKRSEIDDELEGRIFTFLEATLRFIVKTLPSGFDHLLILLHEIFCDQNNFYANCSGSGACEDITDLSDGMGTEVYDDDSLIQEVSFADPSGPTNPDCTGRTSNLARFCSNINVFGRQGGFRELKAELERSDPPPSVSRIKLILAPVHEIKEFLVNDFLLWFTTANERVFEAMMSMSDEDLKSDYRTASDAIVYMSTLYRYTDRSNAAELADTRRLQFALKGFRSQFLERRLASLNDINEILESLDSKESARDEEYGPFWVTKDFMCEWLETNKILEMIFTRNLHLEVLKRSYKIMTFLASNGKIGAGEVEMIWEVAAGKHETIQKNIYDLLLQITRCLKPEILKIMVDLIRGLPHGSYTQQHIDMLRVISGILVTIGSKKPMEFQFLGPEVLWDLVQDDVRFSQPELHICALHVLVEVLDIHDCRHIRGEYFAKCVNNLSKHRSVPQSLVVMNKLLHCLASKRKKPDVDWTTFECVRDEQELLQLVIDDLVIYQTKATAQFQAQPLSDRQVLSAIFDGLYAHHDQIDRRQTFIANLVERADVKLSFALAGVLWNALVCQALSKVLQDFALRWFEQIFSSSWTRDAVMDCAEQFFQELVCRQSVSNLSETGFSLFRCLMRLVNWKRSWLQESQVGNHGTQTFVLNFDLVGMSCLWNIAVVANNDVVAGQAISMLNELYQNFGPALQDRVREKREEYVKNCMLYMLQAAKELQGTDGGASRIFEVRVCRCIRLLKTMLSEFEAKASAIGSSVSIRKHGLRLRGEQVSLRLMRLASGVCEAGTRDLPRASVFSNSTLGVLRKEIGKTLSEEPARLRLFAGGRELKDDFRTVSELKLADGDTVHWTSRPPGPAPEKDEPEASGDGKAVQTPGADTSEKTEMSDEELKVPHYVVSRIYFDEIFKMLDSAPQFITSQLWDLLMTLPTNSRILQEIQHLGPSWKSSLCSQTVYGLLYSLQVVESLLDESAVNGGQWSHTFIESGGLEGLLDVILSARFESPDTVQSSECLALLLKLISLLTVGKYSSKATGQEEKEGIPLLISSLDRGKGFEAFIHRLMCILSDSALAFTQNQSGSALDAGREKVGAFAIDLLTACATESVQGLKALYGFASCDAWIAQVLLHNGSAPLRQEVAKCILKISQSTIQNVVGAASPTEGTPIPRIFFLDLLLPLIQDLAKDRASYESISHRCMDLFSLTNDLLCLPGKLRDAGDMALDTDSDLLSSNLEDVAASLSSSLIQSSAVEERNGSRDDQILIGVLRTLKSLVILRPELRKKLGSSAGMSLVKHIFVNCLFSVPSVESHEVNGPPKCKLQRSRMAAFDLLLCFVDDCTETYDELLDLLFEQCSRRELRPLHFYQPSQMDKAPCGYVGLRNLGATCYMNSLLQQLFLIPELRAAILQVPIVEEDKSTSLMYQLQALFGFLQESERQYYETRDLCHAYRDYDGQPVNTSQQMDVDEYFNMLFDKLEKCLKNTPQERILQDCFGGKVVNQIICKEPVRVGDEVFGVENPFKSEREEKFFTLQLEVKHKRNILESLDLFVEGEMLEGDNKYFCEKANQKVDAMKRVCIKELPRTLILHLKRFEFDLDFMKKVKVNDCCEFPTRLNMHPYTLAGIEEREKAIAEAIRLGKDPAGVLDQLQNPPDCEYELVGVLVHTGTADSGHYYSYIKERVARDGSDPNSRKEGNWFLFNDTHVELFDDKEIGAACYGGNEYVQQLDAGQQRPKCVPRSYNAYMLFYERISTAASVDRVRVGMNSKIRVPLPDEIMRGVWTENLQFIRDKQHYDATYFSFMFNFCSLGASVHGIDAGKQLKAVAPVNEQGAVAREQKPDEGFRVMQLAILFVMNTLIHSWDTSQIESWVVLIKSLLTSERRYSLEWALDAFCEDAQEGDLFISCHWLREAMLHCRVLEARCHMLSLLLHIIRLLGRLEQGDVRGGENFIPYCTATPGSRRADKMIARPEVLGLHPLMTDVPHPRTYKGGWDPALEPPDGYIPFPRPSTHVGKFLDKALYLLPDLPSHWRHFGEYFKLLAGVAEIGKEECLFFLSRRAISRSIDLFLNDESPFCSHRKLFIRMGDKFSSPVFAPLLDFISVLVRSSSLESENEDLDDLPRPYTQIAVVGVLDIACYKLVNSRAFLNKALVDGGNYPAVQNLFVHLSWFNAAKSGEIIQVVCETIEEECHEDDLQVHLDLLAMLIAIPDKILPFRVDKFVSMFVHTISEVAPYMEIFKRCVEFLCDLVIHRPEVRKTVINYVCPAKRRDNARWLESWLIKVDHEACRMSAYNLACILAFPSAFVRRSEPPSLPPCAITGDEVATKAATGRPEPDPDSLLECDELTPVVFDVLLSAVPLYSPLAQAADQCRPASTACRLVYLFRAIMYMLKTAAGRWSVDRFMKSMPDFAVTLMGMNEFRADMDFNRSELYKLILVAAQRSKSEIMERLTGDSRWIEALIQNPLGSINGKSQKANLAYNRLQLPIFFRVIKECCAFSAQFTESYFGCQHGMFALTNVLCLQARNSDSALLLLEAFDIALNWEKQGRIKSLDKIRQTFLELLLRRRQLLLQPEHCIPFLERIIFDSSEPADLADDIMLLIDANALECLVNCARSMNEISREPVRQASLRILEQIFENAGIVEKRMPHLQIESKVRKAMQLTECMGLAVCLVKCLIAPQLPNTLRQQYLGILLQLCRFDEEALLHCLSEFLRIYDISTLESVDDALAARAERSAARRLAAQSQPVGKRSSSRGKAKSEAGKKAAVPCTAGADGEGKAGLWVSEIWHAFRGPKGCEDCDEQFFELAVELCRQSWQAVVRCRDEELAAKAVKACIYAAIDTLQGSRSRLAELLAFLGSIGVTAEDGAPCEGAGSAGRPQRNLSAADSDGGAGAGAGSAGADDEQWARALARSEVRRLPAAEALTVRLLLCHKELLSDLAVEQALSGLISAAAPGWAARLVSTVVGAVVADVLAAAEAVATNSVPAAPAGGARGRSGSRSSAGTRDAAALDALLLELRPLAAAARSAPLLRCAVGTDADRDCAAAVQRAMDAAGVKRGNAETEQRWDEIAQLLAAVAAAARALRGA